MFHPNIDDADREKMKINSQVRGFALITCFTCPFMVLLSNSSTI
jgi:hypothetical protein